MTKARTLADNFAADINGITAGTGITGGGTSGTVTITNDMATAINAKGDLVVGTGADAYSRLAVASTAGYVLTVDSAEATGLKWAAAGSAFVGCSLYDTANQSTTGGTDTAITFNSEAFDTDSFHSTVSNTSRITIPAGLGGKYLFAFNITDTGQGTATNYSGPSLRKNGTQIEDTYGLVSNLSYRYFSGTHILDLVAGDYVEVYYLGEGNGTIKEYRSFHCVKLG